MIAFGVAAALFAAAVQTALHSALKSSHDQLAFRVLVGLVGTCISAPLCFVVPLPPVEIAAIVVASAVVHSAYWISIINAYAKSDFSLAYPLARGVVPIVTTLLDVIFLDDSVSLLTCIGMVIDCIGLLFSTRHSRLHGRGLVAVSAAGALTACYSLLDSYGMRNSEEELSFLAWLFAIDDLLFTSVAFAW